MKLEQQVVSLENSQKLAKLLDDKAPDSLFSYFDKHNSKGLILTENTNKVLPVYSIYPAYTVSELGELLPEINQYRMKITNLFGKIWDIEYRSSCYDSKYGEVLFATQQETLVEAMALMLIYLIENKLNI